MINDILESATMGEMLNIIDSDKGGVWHIYKKDASETYVVITFCKYINGLPCMQSQAIIFYDEWETNKHNFEKLAYISEI